MSWGLALWFVIWVIAFNGVFIWIDGVKGWLSIKVIATISGLALLMAALIGWCLLPGLSMLKYLFK